MHARPSSCTWPTRSRKSNGLRRVARAPWPWQRRAYTTRGGAPAVAVISTVVAALAGCATRTVGDSVCGRSIALTRMRYGHGLCQWLKGARIARVYAHRTRRTDRRCDRASSSAIQRTPCAISSAVNWSRSRRAGTRQCPSTKALDLSLARAVAGCHIGPRAQPMDPPAHSPAIRCTQSHDCRYTNPRGLRHRHRCHARRARSATGPCVVEAIATRDVRRAGSSSADHPCVKDGVG